MEEKRGSCYPAGTVVWANLDGFPWWPGHVVRKEEIDFDTLNIPEVMPYQAIVMFFNDNNRYSLMEKKNLQLFLHDEFYRSRTRVRTKSNRDVMIAIRQAWQFIREKDPALNRSKSEDLYGAEKYNADIKRFSNKKASTLIRRNSSTSEADQRGTKKRRKAALSDDEMSDKDAAQDDAKTLKSRIKRQKGADNRRNSNDDESILVPAHSSREKPLKRPSGGGPQVVSKRQDPRMSSPTRNRRDDSRVASGKERSTKVSSKRRRPSGLKDADKQGSSIVSKKVNSFSVVEKSKDVELQPKQKPGKSGKFSGKIENSLFKKEDDIIVPKGKEEEQGSNSPEEKMAKRDSKEFSIPIPRKKTIVGDSDSSDDDVKNISSSTKAKSINVKDASKDDNKTISRMKDVDNFVSSARNRKKEATLMSKSKFNNEGQNDPSDNDKDNGFHSPSPQHHVVGSESDDDGGKSISDDRFQRRIGVRGAKRAGKVGVKSEDYPIVSRSSNSSSSQDVASSKLKSQNFDLSNEEQNKANRRESFDSSDRMSHSTGTGREHSKLHEHVESSMSSDKNGRNADREDSSEVDRRRRSIDGSSRSDSSASEHASPARAWDNGNGEVLDEGRNCVPDKKYIQPYEKLSKEQLIELVLFREDELRRSNLKLWRQGALLRKEKVHRRLDDIQHACKIVFTLADRLISFAKLHSIKLESRVDKPPTKSLDPIRSRLADFEKLEDEVCRAAHGLSAIYFDEKTISVEVVIKEVLEMVLRLMKVSRRAAVAFRDVAALWADICTNFDKPTIPDNRRKGWKNRDSNLKSVEDIDVNNARICKDFREKGRPASDADAHSSGQSLSKIAILSPRKTQRNTNSFKRRYTKETDKESIVKKRWAKDGEVAKKDHDGCDDKGGENKSKRVLSAFNDDADRNKMDEKVDGGLESGNESSVEEIDKGKVKEAHDKPSVIKGGDRVDGTQREKSNELSTMDLGREKLGQSEISKGDTRDKDVESRRGADEPPEGNELGRRNGSAKTGDHSSINERASDYRKTALKKEAEVGKGIEELKPVTQKGSPSNNTESENSQKKMKPKIASKLIASDSGKDKYGVNPKKESSLEKKAEKEQDATDTKMPKARKRELGSLKAALELCKEDYNGNRIRSSLRKAIVVALERTLWKRYGNSPSDYRQACVSICREIQRHVRVHEQVQGSKRYPDDERTVLFQAMVDDSSDREANAERLVDLYMKYAEDSTVDADNPNASK